MTQDAKNHSEDFPTFFRALLKKYNLQQKEVANRAGVSQTYLNHWATGQKNPPGQEKMRQLIKAFPNLEPEEEERLLQFAAEREKPLPILESKPLKALLELVPKPKDPWPKAEVDAWLEAMRGVLYLEHLPRDSR